MKITKESQEWSCFNFPLILWCFLTALFLQCVASATASVNGFPHTSWASTDNLNMWIFTVLSDSPIFLCATSRSPCILNHKVQGNEILSDCVFWLRVGWCHCLKNVFWIFRFNFLQATCFLHWHFCWGLRSFQPLTFALVFLEYFITSFHPFN